MSLAAGVVSWLSGVPERVLELGDVGRSRLRTLRPVFAAVAHDTGVHWALLAGMAWKESSFAPTARGPAVSWGGTTHHGLGIMQVMSFHADRFPDLLDRWQDPLFNVTAGARLLLRDGYGQRPLADALARYGGFVTADPQPYIRDILARASYLLLAELTGELR